MKYYLGTEAECIALNAFLSNTYFNGWNYSGIYEAADGTFYILIREDDLYFLSAAQMMNVVDNVDAKVIDGDV